MLRGVNLRSILYSVAILAGLGGAAALAAQATIEQDGLVYWSDGDSGRLPDGTKFRLHGVDAPETRSLKQLGGADCEAEREQGYLAKEKVVELTRDKDIKVTRDYGLDRYKRLVVDLSIDGEDLATRLVAEGTHQVWDYDGGAPKPDWCGPRRLNQDAGQVSP
ncbi:MAG: thermonuclease family protein [Pseudomonadota bacterium]|nr:thermonuclease family protein [Pseudomonadota bacterium]